MVVALEKIRPMSCKALHIHSLCSLRSWRDFAREYFCFEGEAVNASGKAARELVPKITHSRISSATQATVYVTLKCDPLTIC